MCLDQRYLIREGLCWILGNGKRINFWYDVWIEKSPLIAKASQENRSKLTYSIKVNYFIDNNKIWNTNKLKGTLPKYICR